MGVRKRVRIADRGLAIATALIIACSLGARAAQAAPPDYAGSYAGVGRAAGMSMRLRQTGDKVTGEVADGRNATFHLSGRAGETAVHGSLYDVASAANFALSLKPAGLDFQLTPLTPGGRADSAKTVRYSFARARPAQAMLRATSAKRDATADALAFAFNYRHWGPSSLTAAYADLSPSDRGLINVFDYIQADVMYRLCTAKAPAASIRRIAQNQRLGCRALERQVAKARRKGAMRRFDRSVETQLGSFYTALRCRHRTASASQCDAAGKATSYAAVHWADAGHIFGELTGGGVVAPVRVASAAPTTERSHAAPRHRSRRLRPAPVLPRAKPLLISGGGGATAGRVDDSVLAGADQSQNVKAQAPKDASGGSFGFELRPTPAERKEMSKTLGAVLPRRLAEKLRGDDGKASPKGPARAEIVQTSQGPVPVPRPRPGLGG
jgi:hypothetical protein